MISANNNFDNWKPFIILRNRFASKDDYWNDCKRFVQKDFLPCQETLDVNCIIQFPSSVSLTCLQSLFSCLFSLFYFRPSYCLCVCVLLYLLF